MKNNRLFTIIAFSILFVFHSCKKKEEPGSGVPIVNVDIIIYANNPSFNKLTNVGGWDYITGGVKGILLYRVSDNEFRAYDRNCTYQSSDDCAIISVDDTNVIAVDTCCGSQFSIIEGNVISPPASASLKQYTTTFDGSVLRIFN